MKESTVTAYDRFLSMNGLRDTKQRRLIFETFMEQNEHLTAEALYHILQKDLPQIGQATVYRTLKLLCENGFAHELSLHSHGGHAQSSYFEPTLAREHHDHLVCTQCGRHLEFHNEVLETLQEKIAEEYSFELTSHTHVLYGKCKNCHS
ncbi:transcriptional repressor [Candidatus Haliotispira prima]|uniref:Ferric uptake regulation protein n=1 Tax=Candidatus Haliotispira prima TaxID=3034016 RepID=A0ABY8MFA9_9SPIO|nr:transcriptional repressor [Candidatus Haliotispira prima]